MEEELLETRGTPSEPLQSSKLSTAVRAVERIPGNLYLRMEEKRMEEKRMEEKRMEEKRMEEKRMEEKRMEEKRMEEKRMEENRM